MKWLKKILRIIAIILPCFVALSITTPSFAYSYDVNVFPIVRAAGLTEVFKIDYDDFPVNPPNLFYYTSQLVDNHCVYDETVNAMSSSNFSLTYNVPYLLNVDLYNPPNLMVPCRTIDKIPDSMYAPLSLPPYAAGVPNFRNWDQHWFQYSGFWAKSTYDQEGLNVVSFLNFADVFGTTVPNQVEALSLPFGVNNVDSIVEGEKLIVNGEFWLKSRPDSSTTPNWGGSYFIRVKGYRSLADFNRSFEVSSFDIPCAMSYNTDEDLHYADFYCKGEIPFSYITDLPFGITFMGISPSDSLWSMPSDMFVFDHINVITHEDTTPNGCFDLCEVVGGEPQNAPNSPTSPGFGHEQTDWFSSLVNMFAFNFTNPFSALFMLFTDNNSCVQIPNLAGMLHAEDTEYCPWFDSTTRNILTPVLGVSSVMLVFGFLVRWLGSGSGNMFEDSGSIAPPGNARGQLGGRVGWRRK